MHMLADMTLETLDLSVGYDSPYGVKWATV